MSRRLLKDSIGVFWPDIFWSSAPGLKARSSSGMAPKRPAETYFNNLLDTQHTKLHWPMEERPKRIRVCHRDVRQVLADPCMDVAAYRGVFIETALIKGPADHLGMCS